jgi:hypothetical protein
MFVGGGTSRREGFPAERISSPPGTTPGNQNSPPRMSVNGRNDLKKLIQSQKWPCVIARFCGIERIDSEVFGGIKDIHNI